MKFEVKDQSLTLLMLTAARICRSRDRLLLDDKAVQSIEKGVKEIHHLAEFEIELLKGVAQSNPAQIETGQTN
jgi:hypothetical protein